MEKVEENKEKVYRDRRLRFNISRSVVLLPPRVFSLAYSAQWLLVMQVTIGAYRCSILKFP